MCKHGKNHEALTQDKSQWLTLTYIGVMVFEDDETGPGYVLELRNCSCNGTLAIEHPLWDGAGVLVAVEIPEE